LNELAFLSLSIAWHFMQSLFLANAAAASALTAAKVAPEQTAKAAPITERVISFWGVENLMAWFSFKALFKSIHE
jgi:hypothetical protein